MNTPKVPEDHSSFVVLVDKHGTTRYLNEFGHLHRDGDLPALICNAGQKEWYKNGLRHRDNGPAVISTTQESYYKYGSRHRDDNLPATTNYTLLKNGDKKIESEEYFVEGLRHRDDGPAIQWSSGSYQYYKHGRLHNENGPACHYIDYDGVKLQYWLNDNKVSPMALKFKAFKERLLAGTKKKMKVY